MSNDPSGFREVSTTRGNLFADLPDAGPEEIFETLFRNESLRIERIVSDGQASPPDFWYEQAEDEWVLLVRGEAVLEFDEEPMIELHPGDWVALPAGRRHRVARTGARTVWLAIHTQARVA